MPGDIRLPNESGKTDIEHTVTSTGRKLRTTEADLIGPYGITTRRGPVRKLTAKERERDEDIQFRHDFYAGRLPSGRRSLQQRERSMSKGKR